MSNKKTSFRPFIIFLVAAILSACGPEPVSVIAQPQPVNTYEIRAVNLDHIRRFPAIIEAANVANVSAKVSGKVTQRLVQPGDEVKAGQLLLTIDDMDYKLSVEQAKANYTLAKVSYDRVNASRQKNIATQADYDNAKSNLDQARVALQQSQNQLDYTRIFAPIDGTVVRVNADLYDFVGAGNPLVTLQSTEHFDVKFQVPSDLIRRYNGDPSEIITQVSVDSVSNHRFDAQFKEFSADSDRSTRSFNITLTMPSPDESMGNLFPGMDANVFVNLSDLNESVELIIPSHSVFFDNNQNWVWKVQAGKVRKTAVTIEALTDGFITISSGLKEGDVIVAAGIQQLVDGQAIKVWSEE